MRVPYGSVTPGNPLELALVAAASDPAARPLFYRLLVESPLLMLDLASEPPTEDKTEVLQAGTTLKAACVDIAGVSHTAVFSSLAVLQGFIEAEHKYVSMLGRDLFTLVRGSHVILNPGASYGKQILPAEIESILDGSAARGYATNVVKKDTPILLAQPTNFPHHLTEALSELFQAKKQVSAAYLALCSWPETGEQHLLIGLDPIVDWPALMRDVTSVLQKVAKPDEIIDFVRMDESGVAQHLRKTRPFYKKKVFGIF